MPTTRTHDFPTEVLSQSWLLSHTMPVTTILWPLQQR